MTLSFDGVSDAYSAVYGGVAKQARSGYETLYYYMIKDGRVVLYSQDYLQNRIWYYDITLIHESEEGYAEAFANSNNWVNKDGVVLVRTEVDSLYLSKATDKDGNEYFFDFVIENGKTLGAIYKDGVLKYVYVMDEVVYNTNSTATISATDKDNGKTYQLTLDYSNSEGDVLIIGEETPANKA
jgi:hypothetical protein